jgi:hypothetical protein
MKITEKEYNVQTGETTIVERDATADEIADRAKMEKLVKAEQAEIKAKEKEKTAILDRLGLSADEAKLLLG